MRKLLSLCLALACVGAFVGCGSDSDPVMTGDDAGPVAQVGGIVGSVVSDDGATLGGVTIHLISGETTLETVSDADGAFRFSDVATANDWTLTVVADGFEEFTLAVAGLQDGKTREIDVELRAVEMEEPDIMSGSEVGQLAPDFTLSDADGEPVTLSSYRGDRHVLLAFHRGLF